MNQMSEACDEIPIHKNQSQIEPKRVRGTITAQIHPISSIKDRFVTSFHLASDPSLFLCLYPSFCVYRKPELYILSIFWAHLIDGAFSQWERGRCEADDAFDQSSAGMISLFWRNNRGRGLWWRESCLTCLSRDSCPVKVTLKRTKDAFFCQSVEI